MHNYSPIHFQGIFQGIGSGPTIWVTIIAPPIEMILGAGHGIKFEANLSLYKDILVGFVFVDNTEIMEVDLTRTEINIEDIYISMYTTINICKGGPKSIIGDIILYKQFIYPISLNVTTRVTTHLRTQRTMTWNL